MNDKRTFDLLSSSVRRTLVTILHESGSVERNRLTEALAAAETDADEAADEAARRRIRISLHHNHLPRLANEGWVVYDDETVAPTNRLDEAATELANFVDGDGEFVRV
jgi:hypothetical protein